MRVFVILCACFALTSCGSTQEAVKTKSEQKTEAPAATTPPVKIVAESSPIIIADGSVKIRRAGGFTVPSNKASGKLTQAPVRLWYGCELGGTSAAACPALASANACGTTPSAGCYVSLSNGSHEMKIFDVSSLLSVATLKWNANNRFDIASSKDFESENDDLAISPEKLSRIEFKQNSTTIKFDCSVVTATKQCVTLEVGP